MNTAPGETAWLERLREEAKHPDTTFVVVRGPAESVLLDPNDVEGKTDDELLKTISDKLAEKKTNPIVGK